MSIHASEFFEVFMEELEEHLQNIEQGIITLEDNKESEEAIQSLFRAAHTLKGSSAAMGFEEMTSLTHEMEMILELVRSGAYQVTRDLIDLLLSCLDLLITLKEEFAAEVKHHTSSTHLVEKLQGYAQKDFKKDLVEMITYNLQITISSDCVMKMARATIIKHYLSELCEINAIYPDIDTLPENSEPEQVNYIVTTTLDEATLESQIQASISDVDHIEISLYQKPESGIHSQEDVAPSESREKDKKRSKTVRVDVERLEQLMDLVGELVINQTQVVRIRDVLSSRYIADEMVDELEQVSDHISRIIGELQESVMKARMLPVEQLFMRFPRVVRDLAQTLGKEVELVIDGAETELDRTVLEVIGDPLIHIIRNAIDHGIEAPDVRRSKGKPAKGLLEISAAHKENLVVITVRNDGAPIDPDNVISSAIRKGIITEAEALEISGRDAINLIFRSGFSTAATVSEVSGRGVGMDIVRSQIELLNGFIDVDSSTEGTVFSIKLPLTLAIITGLLVGLSGRTFIIPMSNVVKIVRVSPLDIQSIKGDPVVVIRDEVMPLIWLHDCFNMEHPISTSKYIPVVIVGSGEKRMALVVDALNGNQEIVVKSLGSYIDKRDGISGATILGDGTVGLIVDVSGITKQL
jgi:two-component system, chemotaxis family, sensor kinase CheA